MNLDDTPWMSLRPSDFATKLTAVRSLSAGSWSADELAIWHLSNRTLLVDTEAGIVFRPNGNRAENPLDTGYGSVYLGRFHGKVRWARAHRVVWIAAHGPIPGNYVVNHRNGRRWDNRIANLDLTTRSGNQLHAAGLPYMHVPGVAFNGEEDRSDVASPYATQVVGVTRAKQRSGYARY